MRRGGSVRPWSRACRRSVGERVILIGIDGFSGSGKTTLARTWASRTRLSVVPIEDFYEGWTGLEAGVERAREQLLVPLRTGQRQPITRPWDWEHDRERPPTTLQLEDTVVLEGCGAGAQRLRELEDLTIWVDADPDERERRLRQREDWPLYAPHRSAFEEAERRLAERDRSREEADVVLRLTPDGGIRVLRGERELPEWVRSAS
jgi:uridine kinase